MSKVSERLSEIQFYTILKFLINFLLKTFRLVEMSKFPMNNSFLLFLDFSACKSVGRYPANYRQFTRAPPRLTCQTVPRGVPQQ